MGKIVCNVCILKSFPRIEVCRNIINNKSKDHTFRRIDVRHYTKFHPEELDEFGEECNEFDTKTITQQ